MDTSRGVPQGSHAQQGSPTEPPSPGGRRCPSGQQGTGWPGRMPSRAQACVAVLRLPRLSPAFSFLPSDSSAMWLRAGPPIGHIQTAGSRHLGTRSRCALGGHLPAPAWCGERRVPGVGHRRRVGLPGSVPLQAASGGASGQGDRVPILKPRKQARPRLQVETGQPGRVPTSPAASNISSHRQSCPHVPQVLPRPVPAESSEVVKPPQVSSPCWKCSDRDQDPACLASPLQMLDLW